MSFVMRAPLLRGCAWTTEMDGSRLRFVTMAPRSAMPVEQGSKRRATASLGCESAQRPLAAACLRAPSSEGGFLGDR